MCVPATTLYTSDATLSVATINNSVATLYNSVATIHNSVAGRCGTTERLTATERLKARC